MPNANDLRKTLTDPTPLYFAAGVLDKLREEAPERIAAVRETDPKDLQVRLTQQAKETQSKVSETLGGIDTDIKKLREQAQHVALQSMGYAAEYAVKARETYDELAERGREAVQNWRGEEAAGATQVTVEREPVKVAEPPVEPASGTSGRATETKSARSAKPAQGTKNGATGNGTKSEAKSEPKSAKPASSGSSSSTASTSASASPASPASKKTGATRKTTNSNGKTTPKTES